MASINPNTYIKLLRFDVTKEHQIDFPSRVDQYNYFANHSGLVLDEFTYQRKDNILRASGCYDDLCQYNYLFYQNSSYTNKVYFCYIKRMTYINDNCTDIEIEEDVFQTWQFDVNIKESFIEREHVSDDTIGKHTINEGLGYGDYICYDSIKYENFDDLIYMVLVTKWKNKSDTNGSFNIGGIPYVGGAYICRTANDFISLIGEYSTAGIPEAIYCAYIIPLELVRQSASIGFINGTIPYEQYVDQPSSWVDDVSIQKSSSFGSYIPKNNKMLCFPYQYLLLSNNNGSTNMYEYERFQGNTFCSFEVSGIPTLGCSIKITPFNYDKVIYPENFEEQGIMAGKFPPLNWGVDEFTVWSTQNMLNMGTSILSGATNMAFGVASIANGETGSGAQQLGSGIGEILNVYKDAYLHKEFDVPSAHGNTNAGDINTSRRTNTFYFYKMGIKEEIARSIDDFFTMYGYKVNILKNINYKTRRYWNYIKTQNVIIESPVVPEKDLNNFKALFNNGFTIWHDPDKFMNYAWQNDIL